MLVAAGALLVTGAGCVADTNETTADVFISGLQFLAAGDTGCAVADTGDGLVGPLTKDAQAGGSFRVGIQVENMMRSSKDIDGLDTEPELNIAKITNLDVDIEYPPDITPPDDSFVSYTQSNVLVTVDPNGGTATIPMEVLPNGIINFLSTLGRDVSLQAKVRFVGTLQGGGDFKTNVVPIGIDICQGCLLQSWTDACMGGEFSSPCGVQTGVQGAFTCLDDMTQ